MDESNLRLYALLTTVASWIVCALSLLIALMIAIWLAGDKDAGPLNPVLIAIGLTSIAGNLMSFLSMIAVLLWTYTAHANLRAAGLEGLNYSPAWATFSFFVPFVNLVVPFKAMRELANRSAGEPEWFAESTVDVVTSWWSCFVISAVVGAIVSFTMVVDALPGVWVTTPVWAVLGMTMFGQLLYAAAAFFIIKVVKMVTSNQLSGAAEGSVFE